MVELNTLTFKKWLDDFAGTTPTIDITDNVLIGDYAIDTSQAPYLIWQCFDNTDGAPVWKRVGAIPDHNDTNNKQGGIFDTDTKLLYNMDGTNGSTTITDSSMSGINAVALGNAQVNTSIKKFGTGSVSLDGSGDALSFDASSIINTTMSDFTIDFWVYPNNNARGTIFGNDANYQIGMRYSEYSTDSKLSIFISSNGTSWDIVNGATTTNTLNVSSWNHVAIVRSGSTFTLYINGVSGTSFTSASSIVNHMTQYIGVRNGALEIPFNGYIDEFRISHTARWVAAFTPPASSYDIKEYYHLTKDEHDSIGKRNVEQTISYGATITPDLSIGNCVKVGPLTGNITVNNPTNPTTAEEVYIRFVQDATGGRIITLGSNFVLLDNNVAYSTAPNAITYFSGIVQSDGTIEGGFGPVDSGMNKTIYDPTNVADDAFSMDNMNETSTKKIFTDTERTKLASIQDPLFLGEYTSLADLQSAHPTAIAGNFADVNGGVGVDVVRYVWDTDDTDWIAGGTGGGDMNTATYDPTSVNGDAFNMDNMNEGTNNKILTPAERTILGNTSGTNTGDQDLSALALKSNVLELDNTTTFTPSADYEPATKKYVDDNGTIPDHNDTTNKQGGMAGDPDTKLLYHFDEVAGATTAIDASGNGLDGTCHNGATIGNSTVKFGSGSLELDGIDDSLTFDASTLLNTTVGDFTIDFWCHLGSYTGNIEPLLYGESDQIQIEMSGNAGEVWFSVSSPSGGSDIMSAMSSADLVDNQWNHVALVRNGNDFTAYINGDVVASATSSLTIKDHSYAQYIGTNPPSTDAFDGQIDEFRISHVARWTAAFTPPTAPYKLNEEFYHLTADEYANLDMANAIHSATAKTTPVDADEVGIVDTADSNKLKKLSWTNIKATLKSYFDSIYEKALGNPTTSGYILSSTDAGVRSWIAPPSGGSTYTNLLLNSDFTRPIDSRNMIGSKKPSESNYMECVDNWSISGQSSEVEITKGTTGIRFTRTAKTSNTVISIKQTIRNIANYNGVAFSLSMRGKTNSDQVSLDFISNGGYVGGTSHLPDTEVFTTISGNITAGTYTDDTYIDIRISSTDVGDYVELEWVQVNPNTTTMPDYQSIPNDISLPNDRLVSQINILKSANSNTIPTSTSWEFTSGVEQIDGWTLTFDTTSAKMGYDDYFNAVTVQAGSIGSGTYVRASQMLPPIDTVKDITVTMPRVRLVNCTGKLKYIVYDSGYTQQYAGEVDAVNLEDAVLLIPYINNDYPVELVMEITPTADNATMGSTSIFASFSDAPSEDKSHPEIDKLITFGYPSGGGSGGTVQGTDHTYDIRATNEGATAGGTRGENSVDLQTDRTSTTQIAGGIGSRIIAGKDCKASGNYSDAGGEGAYSTHRGERAYSSFVIGAVGECQTGDFRVGGFSSSTSQIEMFLDGISGGSERFTLIDEDSYVCFINIMAKQSDGSIGSWDYKAIIGMQGTTTVLKMATSVNTDYEDTNIGSPTISITADDTNDALVIKVTPANATYTRWLAKTEYLKINY